MTSSPRHRRQEACGCRRTTRRNARRPGCVSARATVRAGAAIAAVATRAADAGLDRDIAKLDELAARDQHRDRAFARGARRIRALDRDAIDRRAARDLIERDGGRRRRDLGDDRGIARPRLVEAAVQRNARLHRDLLGIRAGLHEHSQRRRRHRGLRHRGVERLHRRGLRSSGGVVARARDVDRLAGKIAAVLRVAEDARCIRVPCAAVDRPGVA